MSAPGAPLRVLVVTPDFPPLGGGIQLLIERVVQHLEDCEVRVLTLDHAEAEAFDRTSNLHIRRVGRVGGDHRRAVLRLNVAAVAEAVRFRPDVILSAHAIVSLGPRLLRKVLRVPLVQYVLADEIRVRRRLVVGAVGAAEATIAISRYTYDLVAETGAELDRVHIIHPGVDLPDGTVAERSATPTLLTVASLLFRYKGHDMMVRAMPLIRACVPGARWVVIGDGPFRPALESAIAAHGLEDCVELLGRVDDDVRNAWLDRAGVFCMPSRVPAAGLGGEGFGIVYMEASAHGLPPVGGNVAGALDAVVDGSTGLLVDPTDYLAIADAAIEILANPERAAAMAAAGREYAAEHSWTRIAGEVEALLREVAAKGVRRR